jgi:hypothetical protein
MKTFLRETEVCDSTKPAVLHPIDLQFAIPYDVAALAQMAEVFSRILTPRSSISE